MSRILSVANKLLSLRGCIRITGEHDELAYQARGELALLAPTWRVYAGEDAQGAPSATIRKRVFAWAPTWDIQAGADAFQIRKKLFSWSREYRTIGGPYDGAVMRGNLWDLQFAITHGATVLATAAGTMFSLRDRHSVRIPGEGEWFVALAMLVMQIDRLAARTANASD